MRTPTPKTAQAAATPGRRTIIAAALLAALAGLSAPALADSPVVISQVYGGGGNSGATYKNDFIEIFNRSDAAVDITGWSVQYASASGSSWRASPVSGTVLLQPGQYYLLQQTAGTGGTEDLPTPDATGPLALSGSAGKVALASNGTVLTGSAPSGGAVMDFLGFNANAFEGATGPGLNNTTAALRANGGCADTDNNAADFSAAAPTPRNSASPRNACGVAAAPPIVASCPASLSLAFGVDGGAALSASDQDGIVGSAAITSGAVPGISLVDFVAATAAGGSASATLSVAASVQAGSYPIVVTFGNDQAQQTSCTIAVGIAAPAGLTHTIPQIQGAGATSPYAGTIQTTEGVVTAKVGSGFFIQDRNGDGDPLTSDGLFVYTTAANSGTVQVGDLIRISGSVTDYAPVAGGHAYTELQNVSAIVKLAGGIAITPTNIELPHPDLAQVEGMLVRFSRPLTVSQLQYLGDRGEATLSSGRLQVPTNQFRAGSAEAIALAAANARNQIILDDGIFTTPTVIPYLGADGSLRAGDTVADLTGVVDFGAKGGGGAGFKLQPTVAPLFSQDNPRPAPPALAAGNVKVASANVLNYFTTFTNGNDIDGNTNQGCALGSGTPVRSNCRGADNLAEFTRQSAKIVGELKAINADVYGLMEIQNSGEYSVTKLVDALNESIAPGTGFKTYAIVPKPAATGTDAIRVAMIYKPAVLTLVGNALSDADAINNRPPMAQTFAAANGGKFSLIVNHLKSKGSCPAAGTADGDKGDGQSCWNPTRIAQAQRLVDGFVPQVVAAAGDARVLLIGDFNSYGNEDPIHAILAKGYVNQLERFVRGAGALPYSYVFNGEAGYLDHALASAALNPAVVDAAEWHNNADEPPVLDYNLDGKAQDKYTAAPYRASDHDPVVVSLKLQASALDVSAKVRAVGSGLVFNRATGKYVSTFTITNTGATALAGPLQVSFNGLAAGISLANASGTRAGAPYITVDAAALAPGQTVSFPLSFSKTGTSANISYSTTIYSGSF